MNFFFSTVFCKSNIVVCSTGGGSPQKQLDTWIHVPDSRAAGREHETVESSGNGCKLGDKVTLFSMWHLLKAKYFQIMPDSLNYRFYYNHHSFLFPVFFPLEPSTSVLWLFVLFWAVGSIIILLRAFVSLAVMFLFSITDASSNWFPGFRDVLLETFQTFISLLLLSRVALRTWQFTICTITLLINL